MPHHQRKPIESDISVIVQLTTYLAYGILTVLGYTRDWIERSLGYLSSPRKGYAPITRHFESFYRRRVYGRIVDVFNRPVTGPAAGVIKLLKRHPPKNGRAKLLPDVEKSLLDNTGYTPDQYTKCLNLSSYNYLGFGQPGHPVCEPNVLKALSTHGCSTTAAPLYGGNTAMHQQLEQTVAKYLSAEDAMVFGMGFGVNATVIPALASKGSLIISDSINHNSIVTGARSSGATIRTFPHDDMVALDRIVRKAIIEGQPRTHRAWKKILIIVEGVYSMEGEICDLAKVIEIKKKYKCYVYLDEAHSIGAVGKTGRGVCEHAGVDPRDVDILMGTFTKSFGAIGGYIAGKKTLIEPIRNICASQMFSAGLSPVCVSQILSAFQVIDSEEGKERIRHLHEMSDLFRAKLKEAGLYVIGDDGSAVVPCIICHPGKIRETSIQFKKRGIAVVVVGFPAVPILFARTRFCMSANHTREQILYAVEKAKEVAEISHLYYKRRVMG
eukprot:62949_1